MLSKRVKKLMSGKPEAVGYRVMVKPIYVNTEMEHGEIEQYETLAEAGFETRTEDEAKRQSKGTNYGEVVHIGPAAFKGDGYEGTGDWVKEGDVVLFDRYAGVQMEIPPGSGNLYQYVNDQNILGRMT